MDKNETTTSEDVLEIIKEAGIEWLDIVDIREKYQYENQYINSIQELTTQSPVGLTKSSIRTISSTEYSVTLTWTPTASQQGSYIICFTAEDNLGWDFKII